MHYFVSYYTILNFTNQVRSMPQMVSYESDHVIQHTHYTLFNIIFNYTSLVCSMTHMVSYESYHEIKHHIITHH